MKKKILILTLVFCILLLSSAAVFADDLPDMSPLRRLFGEAGVLSFHLEDFNLSSIDFDMLLRIVGTARIDYSKLNYDAFLDLLEDPEVLADLGIESVNMDELQRWLQDPSTGDTINAMMREARQGGSFSAAVQSLSADPDFLKSFSAVTNGKDFSAVMASLASGSAPNFLNKAASALLTPQTGYVSDTARTISQLVQNASAALGWK